MLSLAKLGKGAVSGGLTLKAAQSTVERLALSDLYLSHGSLFPPFALGECPKRTLDIILQKNSLVKCFFKLSYDDVDNTSGNIDLLD